MVLTVQLSIQVLRKDVDHVLCNVRDLQCIYKACHRSLSWAKCIHVKSPVSISKDCKYNTPTGLVTGQIPSNLSTKITNTCAITVSPMHATCLTQFIHDFISCGEDRKLQMCLLWHSMHLPVTSSATGSNAPQTTLHFMCKTRRKRTVISREGSTQKRPEHKKQ